MASGDKTAVVWTRATGEPRRLGLLVLAGSQVRFTYDVEAADLPGISLVHEVPRLIGLPQVWEATEANPLPPMFQALVPPRTGPGEAPNLQRRLLMRILEMQGRDGGGDIDWKMLLLAGRNAIGHLDVFADDGEAADFYRRAHRLPPQPLLDSPLWELAYRAASASAEPVTLEAIIKAVGVHPTPGGAMPKLLLPILPPEGGPPVEALVKIQNDLQYPDVLLMEDIGYLICERVGLPVPRRWLMRRPDGGTVLATERFDRVADLPVPMESLFSTMYIATAGKMAARWSEHTTRPNFEMVGAFLQAPQVGVTVDKDADAASFYTRLIVNLLIGNSDMHLENFAFLGQRGRSRLSPVYDPAPTCGYRSLRCVSVVSFGSLVTSREALSPTIGEAAVALAASFGLQRRRAVGIVKQCLAATADYPSQIEGCGAAASVVRNLLGNIAGVRHRIEAAIGAA